MQKNIIIMVVLFCASCRFTAAMNKKFSNLHPSLSTVSSSINQNYTDDHSPLNDDLESASTASDSSNSEIHSFPAIAEAINPVHRKRSAWTNFYVVNGLLIGAGTTLATVTYCTDENKGQLGQDEMLKYGISTALALTGCCCTMLTHMANIFHNTCKKTVNYWKD